MFGKEERGKLIPKKFSAEANELRSLSQKYFKSPYNQKTNLDITTYMFQEFLQRLY